MMVIDRSSHLPLYIQLKELLLENIHNGTWKPSDKLPTEEEIQKKYDLSRTTVRQALREMELEGIIQRQAGRGTFVSRRKIQEGTEPFNLDISELHEQGLQLIWKVTATRQAPAPENVAAWMQVKPGTPLFCLERLRMANDEPIGYALSYVSLDFAAKIDLSLADKGGTMNYLTPLGLEHYVAERVVEALPAEREDVRILSVERCSPMLVINRVLRTTEGTAVEYFRGVYRGDRFRYHIQDLPPQV